MAAYEIDPAFVIADEPELRTRFQAVHTLAALKSQPGLDAHAQEFIRRAPFLCLGTQDMAGRADVSPRGDPPGFVRILDDSTLAIPDRPGNNRLDSLVNILANPSVGLLFIIPGFDDTLRVNGEARLVTEPGLLASLAVGDRVPKLAIVVTVREAFLHCAKAFRRSQLWDPAALQDRSTMPSLMHILLDQTTGKPGDEELQREDEALEEEYKQTMY